MDAFIAANKYIVRENVIAGAGVAVALDENIAKSETCRRRNVASKNRWMLIDVPERDAYLDTMRSMTEQSAQILTALQNNKFLCTLFVNEARQFLDSVAPGIDKDELSAQCEALLKEKYDFLMGMKSGQALIDFMEKRCISKEKKAKVSALLWTAGVAGAIYNDNKGERILIFNAQEDIYPLATREGIVSNTPLIA